MSDVFRHTTACLFALCISWFVVAPAAGQTPRLPLEELRLDDMSAFRSPGANWQIVGGVRVDRSETRSLRTTSGEGVLANRPTDDHRDNLSTKWEHGDLRLELDYMMPRGSNSGIYLMGRYEIQLLDSWGKEHPTFADAAGIYQRWAPERPEGQRGYEGHPPRVNVSRAPGLWQHLEIVFRAPRFDEDGDKVANARFVRVVHNGVTVHQGVEVTGPTRAAAFEDEQPQGPLMIQGDHGPIAFRNIRYKRYGQEQVHLDSLRYSYYEGEFEGIPDVTALTPERQRSARELTWRVSGRPDQYALAFEGTLQVPTSGTYLFDLESAGGSRLLIDDQTVVDYGGNEWGRTGASGQVDLEAGSHPFELIHSKPGSRQSPALGLFVEGPDVARQPLHAPASLPQEEPVDPIFVAAQDRPRILRSFITHDGDKRTYSVSVGEPSGPHYSLDLGQAALLQIWKGDFLDATPMWHSRGNAQVAVPLGSVIELSGKPTVAFLGSRQAAWPDSLEEDVHLDGYTMDAEGRPTYRYRLNNVHVEDHLEPGDRRRTLNRTLRFNADGATTGLWTHLATGTDIEEQPDGSYAVDDYTYYVDVQEGDPVVRRRGDHEELLVPVELDGAAPAEVSYSIIW